jgi:hypothetical protein
MMIRSRNDGRRGFASMDALFSILPLMLMLLFTADAASSLAKEAAGRNHREEVFDRLLAVADFTVKSGAAIHDKGIRHPNWINGSALSGEYSEGLRKSSGLSMLSISLSRPEGGHDACIYRFVVVGEGKAIGRLFVCGS